jgi:transposase-like protein
MQGHLARIAQVSSEQYVVKAGFNNTGSQRMRCQQCIRYFTPQRKPMGYDKQTKEQALRLYLEGMSMRGIGKVLRVNHQSVANWIDASHAQLPPKVTDTTPADKVAVDELFTFIGKKRNKPTW